jgi:hypothetical protein
MDIHAPVYNCSEDGNRFFFLDLISCGIMDIGVGWVGRGSQGREKRDVSSERKGRVYFFPFDAAAWARALKP